MEVNHPINDPSLVSYHRPELQALLSGLELSLDCWHLLSTRGRGSEKAKYLPKDPGEPSTSYKGRVARSAYTPIFRDSIRSYAGLLSRFQLIDPPSTLIQAEQNVDLQGSSVYSFYNRCDELAIRDGGVFIMVDMPQKTADEDNYIDELRVGRTPYLIAIERRNVINWSVEYQGGREVVKHATVRLLRSVSDGTGYGCKIEPYYLVVKPGVIEPFRLERNGNKWTQVSEGARSISLRTAPIIWYGSSSPRFAQGDLPLAGLAELSIQHYQMRSDLIELLHKCAMPVPVRNGAPIGASGRPDPLLIGSNTAVDLPENGKFAFAEPTGKSLERHQAEIEHVEALMDRSGMMYLYGSSVKTATEAYLRSSQTASQISELVKNKQSSFTTLIGLWAAYTGEQSQLTRESGIDISDSLISRPLEPSGVAQIINLCSSKMLSRRSGIEELQRGGTISPEIKVDEELRRIDEEEKESALRASPAVAPGQTGEAQSPRDRGAASGSAVAGVAPQLENAAAVRR